MVSLASQAARSAVPPPQTTQDATPIALASILAHKHLDSIASAKRRLEPALDAPRPSQHRPFTPLIFSLGGLMESGTRDALQLWKSVVRLFRTNVPEPLRTLSMTSSPSLIPELLSTYLYYRLIFTIVSSLLSTQVLDLVSPSTRPCLTTDSTSSLLSMSGPSDELARTSLNIVDDSPTTTPRLSDDTPKSSRSLSGLSNKTPRLSDNQPKPHVFPTTRRNPTSLSDVPPKTNHLWFYLHRLFRLSPS